jgi:DNA-binding CsgD family transcriptional regulator
LVGRDVELAAAAAAIVAADRTGVVLAGPAGVGKTRLAAECAGIAEDHGFRVARVIATRSAAGIPLGALAPLLPELSERVDLRADLLSWAADALAAENGRLLLVVDDAHLLDDASAIVVHQLAHAGRSVVVATVRSGTPVPEPIHALWKDGLARRIDLRPLGGAAIDDLVDRVLPGPIDGACRWDLREASGGNPLLLHELVLGAIDADILGRTDGVWRLVRSLAVTPRLVEVVEARLVDLDEGEHDVLDLLAVGEPLDLDLLSELADPSIVERLERHQLVDVVAVGRNPAVRLVHPLYGEVLRKRMTALRAMAVNRQLADAAEVGPEPDPAEVLRAAVWRLDGGGDVDPDLMLAAARRAYFAHDDALAERLAGHAWSVGGGLRAGLLRAQVLGHLGRHEERCRLDVELAARATSDEERTLVAMDHAIGLWWGLRRGDAAVEVLARAERAMPPGAWRDEVTAQWATFDLLGGRFADALGRAQPVLEHSASRRARVTAAIAVAPALAVMGREAESLVVADAALAAHLALGDEEVMSDPGIHVVARVLALAETGRLEEARQTATVAYDMTIALHNQTGQAWLALLLGRVGLLTGELADAGARFREGAQIYQSLGEDGPRRWCLAGQVMAAAMRADRLDAAAARTALEAVPPQPTLMMEPDVLRAVAWETLVSGDGDIDGARHRFREAATAAEGSQALTLAMHAWHDLARIGFAVEAQEPLQRLATRVGGPLAECRAAHARGLVHGDVAELNGAADGFERCGALLCAAEAVAHASVVAHRLGQARAAGGLSRRAHALAARCQGASTPGLDVIGPARVLTKREREVARLAADGLTSKAIAARLGLAVRTVENHVQRAYEKLGVSDRTGLREALAGVAE